MTNYFNSAKPRVPHLVRGQGGLAGEIADLRQDTWNAFQALSDSGGVGDVAPSGSVFVDAGRGTAGGQRNNMAAPFQTIQQAVDAAESGDTIFIVSSLSGQNAIVPAEKPDLKIVGLGRTIVDWYGDGNSNNPTLVALSSIRLENFRIWPSDDGCLFVDGSNSASVMIEGVRFEDWVEISNCSDVRINRCDIEDMAFVGCGDVSLGMGATDKSAYFAVVNSYLELACANGATYIDVYAGSELYLYPGSVVGSISTPDQTANYLSVSSSTIGDLSFYANIPHDINNSRIRTLNLYTPPSPASVYANDITGLQYLSVASDVTAFLQNTVPPPNGTYVSGTLNCVDAFGRTVPPSVTDDNELCFRRGSLWFDESQGDVYMCLNAATGAAVWVKLN